MSPSPTAGSFHSATASALLLVLAVSTTGCLRPAGIRSMMSDAHDLPCLAEDTARALDYNDTSPLGFAPRDVESALGDSFEPVVQRRPASRFGGYELYDAERGFLPAVRLVDIVLDPDGWELVDRPARQGPNGSRGFTTRIHAPNGGPRPDFTCMTGEIVRGWGTATAVFEHEEYGELTWELEGWVEAQSTDPDELVLLFADWRKHSWRIPRKWRSPLKDDAGRDHWRPMQAQAVVEGQLGWGGWFSVHVLREERDGDRIAASPLVDFRWYDVDYDPYE